MTTATAPDTDITVPELRVDEIHEHPANPRINAVADAEMVASVLGQGILEPLMVAPAVGGDGWILIDGHRRLSAAQQAGLPTVPVNPRYDLVTEAQQIEVMAVTGLQKALLTPVEEAAAYEQLSLLGMDDNAIALATGFGVRRVKQRRKLTDLSDQVRSGVHQGDISLVDVQVLDEFADDPAALAELEEVIGTANFKQRVYVIRDRRTRAAARAEQRAAWDALGAAQVVTADGVQCLLDGDGNPDSTRPVNTRALRTFHGEHAHLTTQTAHPDCLGFVVPGYEFAEPYLVCFDLETHGIVTVDRDAQDAANQARRSEWEKAEAARAAEKQRATAAGAARVEWLREHFEAMFPTKSHRTLADAAKGLMPLVIADEREMYDQATFSAALRIPRDDDGHWAATLPDTAASLHTLTPTGLIGAFAAYLAVQVAEFLATETAWIEDFGTTRFHLGLWDWMQAAGYDLSDYDREIRARLESKLLELTSDET